ncbi:MAG: hypothetical protein M1118_07325 [Chloroflexi bacterium]|nr:hypothetical protein [Chloroflexota bacterium]
MSQPVALNSPGRPDLRSLAPSVTINAVLPFVAYRVFTARGVPTVEALVATAVFPVAGILLGWARSRHLDGLGLIALVLIILGVFSSLISGSVRFYLVKESLLTGLWGLACLVSLLLPRPLMFYFGRQFATGGESAKVEYYNSLWRYPLFRHGTYLITTVWGLAYLGEALLRVLFAFTLPPSTVLAVSPVLVYSVTIVLIVWTMRYSQSMARRGAEERARAMQ